MSTNYHGMCGIQSDATSSNLKYKLYIIIYYRRRVQLLYYTDDNRCKHLFTFSAFTFTIIYYK